MKLEQLHRTLLDLTDKYWQATRTKRKAIEEQIDTSDPDSQAYLAYMETTFNPTNTTVEDVAREIRDLEERVPEFRVIYLGQFRGGFGLCPIAQEGCGKLGATSTDFEGPCKKSARNIGIDQEDTGETAPHLASSINTL